MLNRDFFEKYANSSPHGAGSWVELCDLLSQSWPVSMPAGHVQKRRERVRGTFNDCPTEPLLGSIPNSHVFLSTGFVVADYGFEAPVDVDQRSIQQPSTPSR